MEKKFVLGLDRFATLLQRLQHAYFVGSSPKPFVNQEDHVVSRSSFLAQAVCPGWVVPRKLVKDHITLSCPVNNMELAAALENGHSLPGPEHGGLLAGCMFQACILKAQNSSIL